MKDRRSEAQTDYPIEGEAPRRRYPPPPRPAARAARAARAAKLRPVRAVKLRPTERGGEGREHPLDQLGGAEEAVQDESPSLPAMVGIVALSVAVIILVSFAAGYGFGRFFL